MKIQDPHHNFKHNVLGFNACIMQVANINDLLNNLK